jgi:hypothetical protein
MRMIMEPNETCGELHAISDVYCEKRRRFLVEYPTPLVIGMSLAGLLAFLLIGFLGYVTCPASQPACSDPTVPVYNLTWDYIFRKPWPLYLWFIALTITMQASIFRNARLRAQLVATLVVTLISSALIGWLVFYGPLQQVIYDIEHLKFGFLRHFFSQQWTYTILNFFIIILFFADTALRYIRRSRGLKADESLSGTARRADPNDPRAEEQAAGDLIAGMALFGVMALVFTFTFIHNILGFSDAPANVANIPDSLAGALPFFQGADGHGIALSQIDRLLALLCLPLGFIVLALSATLNGLSAVRAVTARLARPIPGYERTADSVTAQVSLVLFNAVRAAVDRYVRLILLRILLSLRNVLWIILVFVATFGLAILALDIQDYIHNWPRNPADLFSAVPAAGVAVLGVVLSAALVLFSRRVATNSLRLLGWIAFVLSLTFWLFSGTMLGINWLGEQLRIVPRVLSVSGASGCTMPDSYNLLNAPPGCNQPFAVSYLTFLSVGFLLVLLLWMFARQALGNLRAAGASRSDLRLGAPSSRADASRTSAPSAGGSDVTRSPTEP